MTQATGASNKHHHGRSRIQRHVHTSAECPHKSHWEARPPPSVHSQRAVDMERPSPQPGQPSHTPAQATSFTPYLNRDNRCIGFRHGGGSTETRKANTFFWCTPFYPATHPRLDSSCNPNEDATINDLELGALLMQLLIFSPRMKLLVHIHNYVDNMAAQGWANRGSISTASAVGPILQDISLATRRQHIHAFDGSMPGEENKMADAASRLTHLPDRKFISHLRTHFLQSKP